MATFWKPATWLVLLLFLALFFAIGCKPEIPSINTPQTGAQLSPIQTPSPSATALGATATPNWTATPPLPEPTLTVVAVPAAMLAGEKIAFLKDNNLQLINVASRTQFQVTTSSNVTHIFGWSHDGSQLLLGLGKYPVLPETDMPGGTDLWALNIGEGKAVQLTHNLEVLSAVWSPVNDQIAYHTRTGDLHLINSIGSEGKQLVARIVNGGLAWSPKGSELAYVQLQQPGDLGIMDIAVVNVIDGSIRQLTQRAESVGTWENIDPQWSLDNQKIIFQSRREGVMTGIYWMMDADGTHLIQLASNTLKGIRAFSGITPRSPIANQLIVSTYDSSFNPIIWAMDFNGNAKEVARGKFPAWSPDGTRIAYVGEDSGLWLANLRTTETTKLTDAGTQICWTK